MQPDGFCYGCSNDEDGCFWDVQLIPDHNKVVLNHWLGLEIQQGVVLFPPVFSLFQGVIYSLSLAL